MPGGRPIPEVTRQTDRGSAVPGARPDRGPVRMTTYLLGSLCVSVALLAVFLFGDRGILEAKKQKERLSLMQAEISRIAADNERLEEEVRRLKSDPAAAEKIVREELNLVRPDDIVIVLPPDWKARATPTPVSGVE
ncbi:MAG: Cell division protein FtsB [Thermoanaerobaculia bacterium]|nr:Cell division protein FtsB [Thermoanaerobaculia bacterium]